MLAQQVPPSPRGAPAAVPELEAVALGDFRIRARVGTGSQGAVYLAHQVSHDRPVALKLLAGGARPSSTAVARFRRQAALLARLDHPGVVRCYGSGAEPGFDYLALEYIDGLDATTLLRRAGGTLPLADALHLVIRCAEALAHAAGRHVVHRDVKPGNVLVGRCGAVKLTDWGAAKPTDGGPALTGEHMVLGTVRYAAPEQVRDARRADHRSDLYALGGVLYELLTGRVPFAGDDWLAILRAKEETPLTPPSAVRPGIPPQLDAVLARMLAPDPADRYPDYGSLIRDLEEIGAARERPGGWTDDTPPPAAAAPRLDVLLVFDEAEYVPLVQHALHAAGVPHDLSVVEDGHHAPAAAARQRRPDVLVLGLTSPTETSLRALAGVRGPASTAAPRVCGLSRSPDGAALLRGLSDSVGVWVTGFADLTPLSAALRAIHTDRFASEPPSSG